MWGRVGGLAAAWLYFASALPAVCQAQTVSSATAPAQPEARLDDIVVDGIPIQDLARRFVEEAARPVRGRGLARWMRPVCVGVVNFRRELAEVIADGVSSRASEFGISIADAPCTPNLLIVGSANGSEFADAWVTRRYSEFRWNVTGSRDVASALDRFRTSSDPVRWWHVSMPTYYDVFLGKAQPAVRIPGQPAPGINVYARSAIRGRTRDDLVRTVVIVDVSQTSMVTIEQLRDYLVMVSFAQIDPTADLTEFESILNIFKLPGSGSGMTEWDETYMRTLYRADDTYRLNPTQQADALAESMETSHKVGLVSE